MGAGNLYEHGYDIVSILKENPGASDQAILNQALKGNRIVITLDKDFGRLIHQYSQKHTGVILLRLKDESPKNITQVLLSALKQYKERLKNKFIILSETKIRFRE